MADLHQRDLIGWRDPKSRIGALGAFDKEDFATAKTKYTEASSLLPAERYPKDRIAESEASDVMAACAQKLCGY